MLLFQLKQVKNVYDARVSQQTEEIGHVLGLCTIKSRFFCRSVKGFTESELCQNTHTHTEGTSFLPSIIYQVGVSNDVLHSHSPPTRCFHSTLIMQPSNVSL